MYFVWLPVDRLPLQPVLGSVATPPVAAGICRVPPPPGSAGGPGTSPWGGPGSQKHSLYSETLTAPQSYSSSSDCTPAGPETPYSGGPAGRDQTEPPMTSPRGRTKYGQRMEVDMIGHKQIYYSRNNIQKKCHGTMFYNKFILH